MEQAARFIILSKSEAFVIELRKSLQTVDSVKIVAQIDEVALLQQAVEKFPVDVLLADLDPSPETMLPTLGEIATHHRDLAVFVTSESTDGQLIIKAMRLGVREFLPKPIERRALIEAVDRAALTRPKSTKLGRLINVIGAAGGVGNTLITTNLAVEMAEMATGQVAAVDLDYRYGQLATHFDVDPKYSLSDLTNSPEELESQVIERALYKHASGVHVLGRPNHLVEADTITAASCVGVLSSLMQLNEYVISDGPTRYDVGGQAIHSLSDVTLLVVQQLVPCVRNAVRIVENLRENGYNLDRAKLICNRAGRGAGYLSLHDVTSTLGLELFASLPDEWEAASGSINLGEPLKTHSPKSKLRMGIREIARLLHSEGDEVDKKQEKKQGLIGRIFAST